MKILERLPLLPRTQSLRFGSRHVPFHRNAQVVWLSVGAPGSRDPQHACPPFPALLDSGNNHDCFLDEHHLVHWAGMQPALFQTVGSIRINERDVPRRRIRMWIHPNVPGTHERDPDRKPVRLHLLEGIAVGPTQPSNIVFPRVPLLGFSAFQRSALDYWFDSKTGYSYLRTADWRSRVVRWLYRFF